MKDKVLQLITAQPKNDEEMMRLKRLWARSNGGIIGNSFILQKYKDFLQRGLVKKNPELERLLRKRSIRTMSGIAPVAVLTKPWACPGKCAYCPSEKDVPRSYLSNEPAVMRAIRNKYDPFNQVRSRLQALVVNGHEPTKIELIVIGGTWSYLPIKYKYWYLAECFRAANEFNGQTSNSKNQKISKKKFGQNTNLAVLKSYLLKEQKKNEKAEYRMIGVTLETRPDYINEEELLEMRALGCTRVEIGVQAIDDRVLEKNKRGHGVLEIIQATALLRAYGFKITYHLMPGLPGSSAKKDIQMFKKLFCDERFQPDQIKFYPTVVTKGSLLYKWWKAGKYKPYSDKVLQNIIVECKKMVPKYVRIIRLIRDIPGESIEAGNKITNLRQIMKDKGVKCACIRCRECREKEVEEKKIKLNVQKYRVANGLEFFISFDSLDGKTLYGFCRLYLPDKYTPVLKNFKFLQNSALVRELHVYGELVSPGNKKKTQHTGLGRRLLAEAERIAQTSGFEKNAVISGVGVRDYYRKLGYKLKQTYLVKDIL